MKSTFRIVLTSLVVTGIMAACSMGGGNSSASPDAVNTAIAQTQQAQATVNANALTAMPATPTPGPTIEYVTMTEDELTALIDQSVNEAVAATEQTTSAVTTTTSDGTVTQEEVTYVYSYYYNAEAEIAQAQQAINAYAEEYAELASEMINSLNAIEAELEQMNSTLSEISTTLDEINSTLSQGLALTQETIAKLETAAQQAQEYAGTLQTQTQNLMSTLQADQQARLAQIAQIQPNNIPTDKLSALQSGFQFVDAAKNAMSDNKLSRDELMNIAQLSVNAQAGFQKFGNNAGVGPDLSQFNGKFNEITDQLAHGQIPQARNNIDQFEVSLGQRPSGGGPNLPGGGPKTRP